MNTKSLSLLRASQQYAYINSPAGLGPSGSFTIEAWIKPVSNQVTTFNIVSKWDGVNGKNSYALRLNPQTQFVSLLISTDGNTGTSYQESNFLVPINAWTHVAVVFDTASGLVRFFFNGLEYQDVNSVNAVAANNSTFRIGTINTSADDCFDGLIDDVRFWNLARAATDININYQRELGGNEAGLQGYWTFDNTYNDRTVNGNNLSVSGTPLFSSDVPFADTTTTSTSTTTTSTSTSTTTTSTSTSTTTTTSTTTSTSSTTSTTTTLTSTSTTTTSTSTTTTSTSTTTTSTSTTTTSTSTTTTSTSTTTTTSTSTSTTITIALRFMIEKVR